MRSWIFIRIASVIAFLYGAAHTAGAPWIPEKGPDSMALIGSMKSHAFEVQGAHVTYWGFYFGFGVMISVFLLLLAVLLWQLGSMQRRGTASTRPAIVSILAAYVVNAAVAWKYFFIGPVALAAAIVLCLAVALGLAGGNRRPG
jgi:hypothetical protein